MYRQALQAEYQDEFVTVYMSAFIDFIDRNIGL